MGACDLANAGAARIPTCRAFIDIGQNMEIGAESDGLKAFHTAGFLGTEYGPFLIPDPRDAVASVQPPAKMSGEPLRAPLRAYTRSWRPRARWRSTAATISTKSLLRSVENAHRLLHVAGGEGVRPVAGAARSLRHLQHRAASAWAACWRAG